MLYNIYVHKTKKKGRDENESKRSAEETRRVKHDIEQLCEARKDQSKLEAFKTPIHL